jgi:hypothetical protein
MTIWGRKRSISSTKQGRQSRLKLAIVSSFAAALTSRHRQAQAFQKDMRTHPEVAGESLTLIKLDNALVLM